MKNRFFLFCLLAALAVSCVKDQQEVIQTITDDPVFYAVIEEPGNPVTRVFADSQLRVLWNADDRVSIFNKSTYNRQYRFDGQDGDNSGAFKVVPNDDFVTSNPLDYVYSVYPYNENTKISNDGEITVYLPAEQSYRQDSFGLGANTMIAVTQGDELMFKNLCGYFAIKLYGDNVSVSSITLKGNNNEPLAGKATVVAQTNATPTLQFDSTEATKVLTLICATPVTLGTSAETATTFWFVIPPTVFQNGFTLTVTDDKNGVFEKVTSGSLEIKRSVLKKSAALQVVPTAAPEIVPEAVDLGLSVKWASFNIGATKPEEYGNLYAWGETEPKEEYSWATYKWCAGSSSALTKYNTRSTYGIVDNKTTLDPEDDAATSEFGGEWRMPCYEEFVELITLCSWENVTRNGHIGYLITGPNGNSIFMPLAGNSVGYAESWGSYWSSDLCSTSDQRGIAKDFNSSSSLTSSGVPGDDWRYLGRTIRAVNGPRTAGNPEPVPEAVDLGLSVKWASCNVGAKEAWESGGRYAWGEIEEKDHYNWDNYKWCNGSSSSITKYCTSSYYGAIDEKTRLDPEDDVATVLMGEEWRMPTSAEMTELIQNCTWTRTTNNGISGYRVMGPNGNDIFIPVSGQYDESGLTWKTSVFLWTADCSGGLYAYRMQDGSVGSNHRHDGLMVRGVKGIATQEETIINLSAKGTANCYIVPEPGKYSFRADVKGGTQESVGVLNSAQVLWESFGTSETPDPGALIQAVSFSNGNVIFETPKKMKDGNAVIAVKDSDGVILWSWHIWLCNGYDPEETDQVYKNDAGTMMDRNLGSLSVKPGDVGCLGLLYQWGRKDPFLGAARALYSSSSNQEKASSSVTWPTPVASSSANGNESYTTAHPMTFITQNQSNYDWYYGTGGDRWTTSADVKSAQDPCPYGYRVPDGGSNGIWEIAGYTSSLDQATMTMRVYILQSGEYATYPAAGFLMRESGDLNYAGYNGLMWSATSSVSGMAYYMDYYLSSTSMQTFNAYKADARPVRCVRINSGEPSQTAHEFVDLGLSVKWATCNVGASKPEEFGDYYAWGETEPKSNYNWTTYKWCNGSESTMTKYNTDSSYGIVDNNTDLDPEDDAAHIHWGGTWRMPTMTEIQELLDNCSIVRTQENGVNGRRFTSRITGYTDKSIFLPAAGVYSGSSLLNPNYGGYYLSSSLNPDHPDYAFYIDYFSSGEVYLYDFGGRDGGFQIRPVCP